MITLRPHENVNISRKR